MKTVRPKRLLPSLANKQEQSRPKATHSAHSHTLTFHQLSFVHLRISALPVIITPHHSRQPPTSIIVNSNGLTLKNANQPKNLPLCTEDKQWLRVDLGRKVEKLEVRKWRCENAISKNDAFSTNRFDKQHRFGPDECANVSVASLLCHEDLASVDKKGRVSVNQRLKIHSARDQEIIPKKASSRTHRPRISGHSQASTVHTRDSLQLDPLTRSKLGSNIPFSQSEKRSVVTSTANSRRTTPVRAARRTRNQQRVLDKTSLLQQLPLKPLKAPKFFQQAVLTCQELDLKRCRFDSQYGQPPSATPLKTTESEVEEDIASEEPVHSHHFEDTFERGMCAEARAQNNGTDLNESGTLCESVFE